MLREGDTVTLSISPTVQLAPYQYLKPHASLSRVMSEDVKGDLEAMADDLRGLFLRSLRVEIGLLDEVVEALEGGIEGLTEFCMKEIGDVAEKASFAVGKGQGKAAKKTVKKEVK